jgi:FKBP-type peptidyl-prolyl cis-trans isomerase
MKKLYIAAIPFLAMSFAFGQATLAQDAPASSSQTPSPTAKPATGAKSATNAPGSTAPKTPAAGGARRPGTATAAVPLKTPKEKGSYAIGQNIGKGLQKDGVDVDAAALSRGIRDAIAGNKSALTDQEAQAALMTLANEVRAKQQAKMQIVSEANKKQGDAFLAANKTKDGVVTLPSGLQYKILKEGTGPKPAAGDKVTCNYAGTLLDGKEFDSSYKRGQPVTFSVGEIIKGWNEALQLMPVGSKWQIFVPPDLAYGDKGAGQEIGPNSTLIFEVELLSIAPKEDAKPADAKPADVKPADTKPTSPSK